MGGHAGSRGGPDEVQSRERPQAPGNTITVPFGRSRSRQPSIRLHIPVETSRRYFHPLPSLDLTGCLLLLSDPVMSESEINLSLIAGVNRALASTNRITQVVSVNRSVLQCSLCCSLTPVQQRSRRHGSRKFDLFVLPAPRSDEVDVGSRVICYVENSDTSPRKPSEQGYSDAPAPT